MNFRLDHWGVGVGGALWEAVYIWFNLYSFLADLICNLLSKRSSWRIQMFLSHSDLARRHIILSFEFDHFLRTFILGVVCGEIVGFFGNYLGCFLLVIWWLEIEGGVFHLGEILPRTPLRIWRRPLIINICRWTLVTVIVNTNGRRSRYLFDKSLKEWFRSRCCLFGVSLSIGKVLWVSTTSSRRLVYWVLAGTVKTAALTVVCDHYLGRLFWLNSLLSLCLGSLYLSIGIICSIR